MQVFDSWRASEKRWLPLQLCGVSVLILLLTGWLWWGKVSIEPRRVFYGMLQNSLRTTGVTFSLEQQDSTGTLRQNIQLQLGAEPYARSTTTVSRNGDVVTTETLGTKAADYTRYTGIRSAEAGKDGKPLDTSKVLNVWSKTSASELKAEQSAPLFKLATLGIGLPLGSVPVPMGNLTPKQQRSLLQQIRDDNVYETDFSKAQHRSVNGRLAYAYDVKIQAILYVRLMQQFAQDLGLNDLASLDPNSFSGTPPLKLTFVVDAHSRQLVEVDYPNHNYKEVYAGYGITSRLKVPQSTITSAELQQRLSALGQ